MPSAGDTVRYRSTSAADVDLEMTGANALWDFSTLEPGTQGADTMVAVSATPFAYQFFFNNSFLYPEHDASYARRGAEFGFQGFTLEDVFDYFRTDATGHYNVGFGAQLNGIPTSVRRIPVDRVYSFPMAFGDTDTSLSAFQVSIPTLGYYGQSQSRYVEVDGWGELILPGGANYQALRVRSILEQRDTVYVDQFGVGFGIDRPQTVEYAWLAPGGDGPVLLVTTVAGQPTTARYRSMPTGPTGLGDGAASSEGRVWPVPAVDRLYVELPALEGGALEVVDALGRTCATSGPHSPGTRVALSVDEWSAGTYLVQLRNDSGVQVLGRMLVTR